MGERELLANSRPKYKTTSRKNREIRSVSDEIRLQVLIANGENAIRQRWVCRMRATGHSNNTEM